MTKQDEAILELLAGLCVAAMPLGKPGDPMVWNVVYDKLTDGLMYLHVNDKQYTLDAAEVIAKFKEVKRRREEAKPVPHEGTFRYVKGGEG